METDGDLHFWPWAILFILVLMVGIAIIQTKERKTGFYACAEALTRKLILDRYGKAEAWEIATKQYKEESA